MSLNCCHKEKGPLSQQAGSENQRSIPVILLIYYNSYVPYITASVCVLDFRHNWKNES